MPPVSSRTTMMSTPRSSSALMGEASSTRRMRHDGAQIGEQPERLAQLPAGPVRAAPWHREPTISDRRRRPARSRPRAGTAASVAAGSASPVASMAAPPSSASWNSKAWPKRAATALEHAHRLGGDLAADAVAGEHRDQRAALRTHCDGPLRSARSRGCWLRRIAEFIEAVQQAVPRERLDGKCDRAPFGSVEARRPRDR